jgi:hypothetical protein
LCEGAGNAGCFLSADGLDGLAGKRQVVWCRLRYLEIGSEGNGAYTIDDNAPFGTRLREAAKIRWSQQGQEELGVEKE